MRFPTPIVCFVAAATCFAPAQVRLPTVFGSNMVLQATAQCPIWGWAKPGEKISISADFFKTSIDTVADEKGKWMAHIPTPISDHAPFTGHHLEVRGESSTVALDNVLIGEVWLCSGQSNMEMALASCDNAAAELARANCPAIRLMDIKNTISATPRDDCEAVELGGEPGAWHICTPKTVEQFSAVGYYFAAQLQEQHNVPVGLIGSNWGGTPAQAWTSAEGLKDIPQYQAGIEWVKNHGENSPEKAAENDAAMTKWKERMVASMTGMHQRMAAEGGNSKDGPAWIKTNQPGHLMGEFANFDGIIWCKRTIDVPAFWGEGDAALSLGPIDDMDVTFFDDNITGTTLDNGKWDAPRLYTVKKEWLTPGTHSIWVGVIDWQGLAGIHGNAEQMYIESLAPLNGPRTGPVRKSLAGEWLAAAGTPAEKLERFPQVRALGPNDPTSLFNGMIAPLIPMRIAGAIWYQGESNRGDANGYVPLMAAMIGDWRTRFSKDWSGQNTTFPFYFVQIAPYEYGDKTDFTARLRHSQTVTAREVPNTGMAVTMDIGNPSDIHPKNKRDVGARLARIALHRTYGAQSLVDRGPTYKSHVVADGKVRVTFDNAAGLASEGDIKYFEIAAKDGDFKPAKGKIEGGAVIVWSEQVPEPVHIRYAWSDAPMTTLHNGDGLPAEPFSTQFP